MGSPVDKMTEEPMVRKPILMPPALIRQVEKMAKQASKEENRAVSFAEIVRRALADYEPTAANENELVEALLDGIITSTQETVAEVRKLNRKLDKSAKERSRERNG